MAFGDYKVNRLFCFPVVECSQHKPPMIPSGFNMLRTVSGKVFLEIILEDSLPECFGEVYWPSCPLHISVSREVGPKLWQVFFLKYFQWGVSNGIVCLSMCVRVGDLCSRFHLDFVQSSAYFRMLMFNKSGVVLTKAISRYFISLQFREFIRKPLIQLNAELFDLCLLKKECLFLRNQNDLGTCTPFSCE